jgi:hypothetical protein
MCELRKLQARRNGRLFWGGKKFGLCCSELAKLTVGGSTEPFDHSNPWRELKCTVLPRIAKYLA